MATQIQTMSAPLALPNQSPGGGIITQIVRLFIQPKSFFRHMPTGSQWLFAVTLVLVITGFTATTQIQSSAASTTATTTQTSGFNLSALSATSSTAASGTTTQGTNSVSPSTGTANTAATTTAAVSSDTTLMNGLLAVCGVLVMWAGQTTALSLVTMLHGYAPQVGKCLQIAVWASLPLALMLVLRYAHFASGGSGGSLGVSMLLNTWSGYSTLPTIVQRILAVFTSNLTLFWLWNLLLIYLGARFALGGRRVAVMFIVALWIAAATIVPALVTTPQTRTLPRQTTTTTQAQTSTTKSSSTTASATAAAAQAQGGFAGGQPPSGGFPGAPGG